MRALSTLLVPLLFLSCSSVDKHSKNRNPAQVEDQQIGLGLVGDGNPVETTLEQADSAQNEAENTEELRGTIDSTQVRENQALAEGLNFYPFIEHVDLRDVIQYNKQISDKIADAGFTNADTLSGTSRRILEAITENTARFTGNLANSGDGKLFIQAAGSPKVVYYKNGARGPLGNPNSNVEIKVWDAKLKKSVPKIRKGFDITKRFEHTYNNTLFSVDYISAKEIAKSVIEAKLLLFITDGVRGDFFRRMTVKVDWKLKNEGYEKFVSITNVEPDVALEDTDFKLRGSISKQKIILEDANSGIIKVFPVTVGAIDARDNVVESMNFWVPESNRYNARKDNLDPSLQKEFQDFSNAALVKRSVWSSNKAWANTEERIVPDDYRGRPFLALVDMNYVTKGAHWKGYREVGLHYQITSARLERGFRSHGCVRVRDKDLYQVDHIVNRGPKDRVEAIFKQDLPSDNHITHPHAYEEYAAQVMYTDYQSEQTNVLCKIEPQDKLRKVRWNDSEAKVYHTVIGTDCLTKVQKKGTGLRTSDVISYFSTGSPRIDKLLVNVDHSPIVKAKNDLRKLSYGTEAIESMTHRQRLELLRDLKNSGAVPRTAKQPKVTTPGSSSQRPKRKTLTQIDNNNGIRVVRPQNPVNTNPRVRVRTDWPLLVAVIPSTSRYRRIKSRIERGKAKRNDRRDADRYLYVNYCRKQPTHPTSVRICPKIARRLGIR